MWQEINVTYTIYLNVKGTSLVKFNIMCKLYMSLMSFPPIFCIVSFSTMYLPDLFSDSNV